MMADVLRLLDFFRAPPPPRADVRSNKQKEWNGFKFSIGTLQQVRIGLFSKLEVFELKVISPRLNNLKDQSWS